jgi:cyclase
MLRTRVIPFLQLHRDTLVKSVRFKQPAYIGEPINTVRIFNELEVDELALVDIRATIERREPNLNILRQIADECFMPLSYGGGIRTFEMAARLYDVGVEKVILGTITLQQPEIISKIANIYGAQAVTVAVDVKKSLWGGYKVMMSSAQISGDRDPSAWAQELENLGAGEIVLTAIDREGTWKGFDVELVKMVTGATNLPVIAHGGAATIRDIGNVVKEGGAAAVGLGNLVVYQSKGMGVLINFPDRAELATELQ